MVRGAPDFQATAALVFMGFSGPGSATQLRGDALALAAGTLWGLTTLVIRSSKMATASAEKTLFYQVAVTAAIAPLLSLALGETWSFSYSPWAWTSLALQTAIGAFASYLAWMWMLRHYPATRLSSFTFLTPLFALVLGVVWLGEPLTAAAGAGAGGGGGGDCAGEPQTRLNIQAVRLRASATYQSRHPGWPSRPC
jgi:drug/metabolite transporter (DMT)-like permease